jgi:predicted Zn-dependent protease
MPRLMLLIVFSMVCCACAATAPHSPIAEWTRNHGGCIVDGRLVRLRHVGDRLAWTGLQASQLHVLNSQAVAAYSWPSGEVFVAAGLVDRASDDELTAALAHELGHLVLQHRLAVPATLISTEPTISGGNVEERADAVGMILLHRCGVSTSALAGVLRKAEGEQGSAAVRNAIAHRVALVMADAASTRP